MNHLGARLASIGRGRAQIEADYRKEITQQHGYVHAGVLTSMADSACGYAAYSLAPEGTEILTVEYKVNFLAPAKGPKLVAKAKVLRPGRTITVCSADVYSGKGKDLKLVAVMTATIFTKRPERHVRVA